MDNLDEILGQILVPETNVIQQATQKLKEVFKDPNIVPALCQTIASSQAPQVRQFAAVLLRKKIAKEKQWSSLPPEVCQNIRDNILQILLQEPEKSVRNSVSLAVSIVAKHDLPENKWPQLFQFILQYTKSPDPGQREIGMFILYKVATVAAEQLKPHLISLLELLGEVINDEQNKMVPYYAIMTISELMFFVGEEEMEQSLVSMFDKLIQNTIPRILHVIKQLIVEDEDKACEAMEVFDEMLECEVAVIAPHVKTILDFSFEIASNVSLGDAVRVKSLSFIASVVRLKKKTILKHKMVNSVLQLLFSIMCEEEKDDEEEEDDDVESSVPSKYAAQVVDTMALHLPPEKFIPNMMKMIEPAFASEKPGLRKAAYISMAVVAEGCADNIKSKYLQGVLKCVCNGFNDPDPAVRNAALFCLGQFSEFIQPEISKFASDILPLLFQYLGRASAEQDKNPKGLTKSYYALEMFCENLGKDILPYLQPLMEHLLTVLKSGTSTKTKELAVSAIGATANAAKEDMKPFFEEIIAIFKNLLSSWDDESLRKIQIQSIDTLGVLARTVGKETFSPLALDCIQLGLNVLNNTDDPDMRRCTFDKVKLSSSFDEGWAGVLNSGQVVTPLIGMSTTRSFHCEVTTYVLEAKNENIYDKVKLSSSFDEGCVGVPNSGQNSEEEGELKLISYTPLKVPFILLGHQATRMAYGLFAALSTILKADIGPHLPVLIRNMITSIKSSEGVKAHLKEDTDEITAFNEDDFDEELELDSDDEVLNSQLAGISVENAYIDEKDDACSSLGELAENSGSAFLPYLEESYKEILEMLEYPAESVKKSCIISLGQFCCSLHKLHKKDTPTQESETALNTMISTVVPKLLDIIRGGDDLEVTMTAIDTLQGMLDSIGERVLQLTGATDVILSTMKEVFMHKLPCQDQSDAEEDDLAEFDGMLIESAGDVLPIMASLLGGQAFQPFLSGFLPDLLKRLKETSSTAEKSFAVGTLADITKACGSVITMFVPTLYPLFIKMMKDDDEEVRSNACFALGVLAEATGEILYGQYTEILKCLFEVLNKESEPLVIDNICAAVCRLINTYQSGVPLDFVLPVIMKCLPLKEDFEEYKTIIKCLMKLYGEENQHIMKYVPNIIKTAAHVLGTEDIKKETESMIVEFVHNVNGKFPQEFANVCGSLPEKDRNKLQGCLSVNGPV